MKKSLSALFAALLLSGCTTTMATRPIASVKPEGVAAKDANDTREEVSSGIAYPLAQSYFAVGLKASKTKLSLQIKGPYAEIGDYATLDLKHSTFSKDQFDIGWDRNTRLMRRVSILGKGRAPQITYNLGSSLAAGYAAGNDAAAGKAPKLEHDFVLEGQERVIGQWKIHDSAEAAEVQGKAQSVADKWFALYCAKDVCGAKPSVKLVFTQGVSKSAVKLEECKNVFCYVIPVRSTLSVGITHEKASASKAKNLWLVDQDAVLSAYTVSPSDLGFVQVKQSSLTEGFAKLEFDDGILQSASVGRGSEVETIAALPLNFIGGVANTLVQALPVRLFIDIQRREILDAATKKPASSSAPQPFGAPTSNCDQPATNPPADGAEQAEANQKTRQVDETFILAELEADAQEGQGNQKEQGSGGTIPGAVH